MNQGHKPWFYSRGKDRNKNNKAIPVELVMTVLCEQQAKRLRWRSDPTLPLAVMLFAEGSRGLGYQKARRPAGETSSFSQCALGEMPEERKRGCFPSILILVVYCYYPRKYQYNVMPEIKRNPIF